MRMRTWIFVGLTALSLAACATAATDVPDLPTVLPTIPPPDTAVPSAADATQADQNPTSEAQATQAQPVQNPTSPAQIDQGQPVTPVLPGEGTPMPTSAIQQVIGMLPPPGTAIAPATEEVDAGQAATPFNEILYQESGGPGNTQLSVEIFGDGKVIRNGVETSISADEVDQLNQLIRDVNFFGLEGQFTMPGAGSDVYVYAVWIERADGSTRSLKAHDRTTPPELKQFFARLRDVGA